MCLHIYIDFYLLAILVKIIPVLIRLNELEARN